jgi:alpha-1,3-rhamnosyl/mannosyltransferase
MRTVIDVRTISDHFPGIGRYTCYLACAVAQQDDRDELVLVHNPELVNTRYDTSPLASASNVRMVYTAATPFTLREQLQLPVLLRRLAPGFTHFPHWSMPCAAPRPFALTVHDIIPLRLPQYFTVWQRLWYRLLLRLALQTAEWVICVSEATRSNLQSLFPKVRARLCVIHEGVARSFRPCTPEESKYVRVKYALPDQYVLYVGSNKPHKNIPALINSYARLRRAPLLVLAGAKDPRYPEPRHRVELLGLRDRVRFLGTIPEADLPFLYGNARAFVFPSTYEGFGLPPIEAMACGVPVACSDIPSLREVTGGAALLFNASSPPEIAAALERVLEDKDLREDLRARGLKRAAELTWDIAARKTLDIYHRRA